VSKSVTNDIFTKEDQEFLIRNEALPDKNRIRAIETGLFCSLSFLQFPCQLSSRSRTGGCPHAAIREDISANLNALEDLQAEFNCQLLFVESGGDNLAGLYKMPFLVLHCFNLTGAVKPTTPENWPTTLSMSYVLNCNLFSVVITDSEPRLERSMYLAETRFHAKAVQASLSPISLSSTRSTSYRLSTLTRY
jgi:hypothetical protein